MYVVDTQDAFDYVVVGVIGREGGQIAYGRRVFRDIAQWFRGAGFRLLRG